VFKGGNARNQSIVWNLITHVVKSDKAGQVKNIQEDHNWTKKHSPSSSVSKTITGLTCSLLIPTRHMTLSSKVIIYYKLCLNYYKRSSMSVVVSLALSSLFILQIQSPLSLSLYLCLSWLQSLIEPQVKH
jgi:hypothetical protein